jgi:hypothetical protein
VRNALGRQNINLEMRRRLIPLLTVLTISLGAHGQNKSQATIETPKSAVALAFINEYVKYCDNRKSESGTIKWIEDNKLLTTEFKKSYKGLVEEARKREPELGLGFDPIFDAQDYPDKGFEFLKFDSEEYVMVRGIGWSSFTIVIKVRLVGDKWMVDEQV